MPTLAGRFQIDPKAVLPGLSRPGAVAYAAIDISEPARAVYAIVANAHAPIRFRAIHQTRQMQSDCYTLPIRSGSVDWPASGRKATVLILPKPRGVALMEDLDGRSEPVSNNFLTRVMLSEIAEMLAELESYHVAHRAIRPDNIFYDREASRLTVGESFSVPAGMAQPALFEPIERSVCPPPGRGEGEARDDMYALGVTALFALLGQNPVAAQDRDELLARRRQVGSYAALVGKRRLPAELIQMFRALLRDEPDERWTAEDLLAWLNNGRGAVVPAAARVEGVRPFVFGDQKYRSGPALAEGLAGDWPAAIEVVKSGEVEEWLETSLKDKGRRAAYARCRIGGPDGPRSIGDDLLLARVLIVLDPNGPLRYRDLTVMPDGIGPLMADVFGDATQLKLLVDVLSGMLPAFWMEQKKRPTYAMFGTGDTLTRVMPMLAQQAAGFGVERLLYELNPGLACQSATVTAATATDVTQLLNALDERVGQQGAIFDRHIAAFLATRISGSVDRDLNDVTLARTPGDKLLVQLRLFAYAQGKSDAYELQGLCGYFLEQSPAIIQTFRNIPLRAKLAKAARIAAESGDLERIVKVLSSEKHRTWDTRGFNAARKQFVRGADEIADLQASFATIPERARAAGRQIGAMTAGAMSVAASAVMLLAQLS
jgi:hypothetical protein